ncbi:hypothetical protein F5Y10DRAFT_246439 [Nemania abortiva]|nr:hypothetical protein F5Y10DRAFT_246439 [Nemania abortiva]
MPTSAHSISYINRVPDELLLQILKDAMEVTSPFFPEGDVRCRSNLLEYPFPFPHYLVAFPSQVNHLRDWRLVTSTCRRIRRVGMEAFFRTKTIVMSTSFPGKLRDGTCQYFGSALNQHLALKFTRSIIMVARLDDIMYSLALKQPPWALGAFSKLERSKLVVTTLGYHDSDFGGVLVDARTRIKRILGDIGLADKEIPEIFEYPGYRGLYGYYRGLGNLGVVFEMPQVLH